MATLAASGLKYPQVNPMGSKTIKQCKSKKVKDKDMSS